MHILPLKKKRALIMTQLKFLLIFLVLEFVNSERIIKTKSGPLKGTTVADGKVDAFFGIPYAEPPVGPLRFAKPVPKVSWEETYDATRLPPSCIQFDIGKFQYTPDLKKNGMSEDCLYLNLWVPQGGSEKKTIILFIHGGGFMIGSSNMKVYDGAALSERGDVIVASINYRLGSLGFFYGMTDEAAGNMGLYDQLMAMQWIKDNAQHFSGDPDNIVLMGESAGSMSVAMHLLSPLSKNLFNRAILQSASVFHPFYADMNNGIPKMMSQMLVTTVGCSDNNEELSKADPKSIIECLKRVPTEKFAEADKFFLRNFGICFPRIGDDFLPEIPADFFRNGNFKNTEILIGITHDEGSLLLAAQRPDIFGYYGEKVDPDSFNETSLRQILQIFIKTEEDSKIAEKYFSRVEEEENYTYLKALSEYFGDFLITCGSVFHADFYSLRNNPVYFYLFDYRPPSSPLAKWLGVAHFDEMQYVFGNPVHQEFTEFEEEFSKDMMDVWTTFAKTGNPNVPGNVKWPLYTYQDPKYLILGKHDRVGLRPDDYRCEIWRNRFLAVID